MKSLLYVVFATLVFLHSCAPRPAVQEPADRAKISQTVPDRLLRHVVLFDFRDTATKADVQEIEHAFASLPAKISEIYAFEWGTNNSPEGLDEGLSHCFLVTFLSEADRDAYLPHPAHQEFVELVGPLVENVRVVDYWTKNTE